jgi:hypothetical protein
MSSIRVAVRLAGFDLAYEGSLAFFERVIDPYLAEVAPYPARTRPAATPPTPAPTPSTPAEASPAPSRAAPAAAIGYQPTSPEFRAFLQRLGPEAAEPDRQVLAMAFYLWNYEKKDHVHEREVEGCFRAIGLPPPPEMERIYGELAHRLRFLLPGPEEHTWTLTQKGANYVKTRLLGAL